MIQAQILPPAAGHDATAALRKVGSHVQLQVTGMPAPALGRIYEVWLKDGSRAPQPTDALFSVTGSGRRHGRCAGRSERRQQSDGHRRAGWRQPQADAQPSDRRLGVEVRRRFRCSAGSECGYATPHGARRAVRRSRDRLCPDNGHLLSPPLARDGGLVLELRAADLPRLHDYHPVGMRCPECARQKTQVKTLRNTAAPSRGHDRADRDQRGGVLDRGQLHGERSADEQDLRRRRAVRQPSRDSPR